MKKTTIASVLLLQALMPAFAADPASPRSIIVLDASGSMWGRVEGRPKIEVAREVIADLVGKIPAGTELGLVAYGHNRKGDCADIETLVPAGPVDGGKFVSQVNAIQPKGMTPLTAAVEYAAAQLKSTENRATVILVTDGEETCKKDPCAAAKALEASGVDFTAHVIAFDLDSKAAQSVQCLADKTGGMFLKADDARSLADALEMTLEAPAPRKPEPPPASATLTAPKQVEAGREFEVAWEGPDHQGDYVNVVKAGAKDGTSGNYTYTRRGNPLPLTALIEPGKAEVRYIHGPSDKVLARVPLEIVPVQVSLKVPATVQAGGEVPVEWTGPDNKGDYITVVPASYEDGRYAKYAYTKEGKALKITAPLETGKGEVRYHSGQGDKVLARAPIQIEAATVTLKAPASAGVGSEVTVEWTGPDNKGDYVTIVPANYKDGRYAKYAYTKRGSALKIAAPMEAGAAEVRYHAGQGDKVLARIPIQIEAASVSLKAPATVGVGSKVQVEWTGPGNKGDYITVVPADYKDGRYAKYAYTERGPVLEIPAPMKPGKGEVRYQSGQGDKVLARIPITFEAARIVLSAPAEAAAGSEVQVNWEGPDNDGDYITIVPANAEDGFYASYAYTNAGKTLSIKAPEKAGAAEIRYQSEQGEGVLARVPLKLK